MHHDTIELFASGGQLYAVTRPRIDIGRMVCDHNDRHIGTVTALEWDAGSWWITVNDAIEYPAGNVEEVIVLPRGDFYYRLTR